MLLALQQLAYAESFAKAVVISGSTSALQALSSNEECNRLCVQQHREILNNMSKRKSFQWVAFTL